VWELYARQHMILRKSAEAARAKPGSRGVALRPQEATMRGWCSSVAMHGHLRRLLDAGAITDEELAILKWGRDFGHESRSGHKKEQYIEASALEALVAYWYLFDPPRMHEVFALLGMTLCGQPLASMVEGSVGAAAVAAMDSLNGSGSTGAAGEALAVLPEYEAAEGEDEDDEVYDEEGYEDEEEDDDDDDDDDDEDDVEVWDGDDLLDDVDVRGSSWGGGDSRSVSGGVSGGGSASGGGGAAVEAEASGGGASEGRGLGKEQSRDATPEQENAELRERTRELEARVQALEGELQVSRRAARMLRDRR